MDPKIKCLKCKSYIHDTDHCWNWKERRLCHTDKKLKESCDCHSCKSKEICQYCNHWKLCCNCNRDRCPTCNEYLCEYDNKTICWWDHTKSPCQFCKLPLYHNYNTCQNNHYDKYQNYNTCPNNHYAEDNLCEVCNMPEEPMDRHKHDGTLCKKCGTLLNYGKCINFCVNGGNRCIHCHRESIVDNMCRFCKKEQTGFLTKSAIK